MNSGHFAGLDLLGVVDVLPFFAQTRFGVVVARYLKIKCRIQKQFKVISLPVHCGSCLGATLRFQSHSHFLHWRTLRSAELLLYIEGLVHSLFRKKILHRELIAARCTLLYSLVTFPHNVDFAMLVVCRSRPYLSTRRARSFSSTYGIASLDSETKLISILFENVVLGGRWTVSWNLALFSILHEISFLFGKLYPSEYRTYLIHLNEVWVSSSQIPNILNHKQAFSVRISDHHSNTEPFDNRTQIYHLNTKLVRYSDGYCICAQGLF